MYACNVFALEMKRMLKKLSESFQCWQEEAQNGIEKCLDMRSSFPLSFTLYFCILLP